MYVPDDVMMKAEVAGELGVSERQIHKLADLSRSNKPLPLGYVGSLKSYWDGRQFVFSRKEVAAFKKANANHLTYVAQRMEPRYDEVEDPIDRTTAARLLGLAPNTVHYMGLVWMQDAEKGVPEADRRGLRPYRWGTSLRYSKKEVIALRRNRKRTAATVAVAKSRGRSIKK